jgi:Spy/CpxP family protein refolding chaperone
MSRRSVISAVALAAGLSAAVLPAQPIPWENTQVYEKLGLTEQQTARIQEVIGREDKVIRQARAELNVNKAQLERLLLAADPDMSQVEGLLKSALDWKLKSEMADIRRRIEVRKILGEQKWEQLLRLWRSRARGVRASAGADDPRPAVPRAEPRR